MSHPPGLRGAGPAAAFASRSSEGAGSVSHYSGIESYYEQAGKELVRIADTKSPSIVGVISRPR